MSSLDRARFLAVACALLAGACSGVRPVPEDFASGETRAEEAAPLGGTALGHERREMERAYHDLVHFQVTLESLRYRDDRKSLRRLRRFVDAYMGLHLDPLLTGQWQSRHPELMALDANLRLVKADVLIQMRDTGRAQRVIDEVEERFRGREDMLVDYPIGGQSTLGESLKRLRDSKWQG
jgi:hypothetical protein